MWHWFIFLIVVAVVTTVSVIAVVVWVVVAKKNTKTEPVIIVELEPPEPVDPEHVEPDPVEQPEPIEPAPVEPPTLSKHVVVIHDTFAFSRGGGDLASHTPEIGAMWIQSPISTAACIIDEATNALYQANPTDAKSSYICSYLNPSGNENGDIVNGFDPMHDTLIFNMDIHFSAIELTSRNFVISVFIVNTHDLEAPSIKMYSCQCIVKVEDSNHTLRLRMTNQDAHYAELDEVIVDLDVGAVYELTYTFKPSGFTSLSFRDKNTPSAYNILLTGDTTPLTSEYKACGLHVRSEAGDEGHKMYVDTITVTATTDEVAEPTAKPVFLDTFSGPSEPLAGHVSDSGHTWTKVGATNPHVAADRMKVPMGAIEPGQAHFTMDTTEIGYQPTLDTLTLQLKVQFAITGDLPEALSSISFRGTIKHSTGTPSHYFSCVFDVLNTISMYTPSLGNGDGDYTARVATSPFILTLVEQKTYMIEYTMRPDGFTTLSFGELSSTPFPWKRVITGKSNVSLVDTDTCEFSIEQPQTVDFKGHQLLLDTWTVTAHRA